MLAVLFARNRMLVKFVGVLDSDPAMVGAFHYHRLNLSSPSSRTGVPDLVGRWVIGLASGSSEGLASGFAEYELFRMGPESQGALATTIFSARNINRLDDSLESDFDFACQDLRPIDGGLVCTSTELNIPGTAANCISSFSFDEVGLRRVAGQARCGNSIGDFIMVRL